VNASMENFIHYGAAMALCLAGFHGLFFQGNLAKKAAAWCLFQIGLMIFLFQLASSGAPLPLALCLEVAAVTVAVTVLLGVFCLKLRRRHKTLEGDELSGRVSK
jgi:multisubunit Na+/H+ antiporter MnhC subunit